MAPTNVFGRLKQYYSKSTDEHLPYTTLPASRLDRPWKHRELSDIVFLEKEIPAISIQLAAGLSILYTLLYVLPLYLSSASRPSPQLSRDAPSVIRARIRAVSLSCFISSMSTAYIIVTWGRATPVESLRLLGYWPVSPEAIAKSFTLTALLFAGPLFEKGIVEGGWREWIRGRWVGEVLGSWIGWRNYIAGPITEEIVFRSTLIPLHLLAKISPGRVVFLTPLYFGIAHIHHFYEYTLTHPHTPLLPALVRVLVQFAYTSLFGFYATFLFLRTGSLPAVILAHSFCNLCGLPRFWGRVEAGVPLGPPPSAKDDDSRHKSNADAGRLKVGDGSLGLGWTVVYYVLLVAGAVAFWKCLWTLTESDRALVGFGKGD